MRIAGGKRERGACPNLSKSLFALFLRQQLLERGKGPGPRMPSLSAAKGTGPRMASLSAADFESCSLEISKLIDFFSVIFVAWDTGPPVSTIRYGPPYSTVSTYPAYSRCRSLRIASALNSLASHLLRENGIPMRYQQDAIDVVEAVGRSCRERPSAFGALLLLPPSLPPPAPV